MTPAPARGPSARSLLKLPWEYPVYQAPAEEPQGQTYVKQARKALSPEDALAYLAGEDPRPMLVLRECKVCNGTDDALLSRGNVDNEKTFLLSRWFHCVKLPVDVLEADHPFHGLFDAKDPEHMFLCSADGSVRVALESERSRTELWEAMTRVLKATYAKSPDAGIRAMENAIDDLDIVDARRIELKQRVDELLETEGPDSRKLKKVESELAAADEEREELFRAIDQATSELRLKKPASAPAAAGEGR